MTTLYADNFTDCTTGNDAAVLQEGWSITPSNSSPFRTSNSVQRRTGVNSVALAYGRQCDRPLTTTSSTVFMSFAVNTTALPSSSFQVLCEFRDINRGLIARVCQNSAGQWRVDYGLTGTTILSAGAFSTNQWYWVQLKVVINDTTGSVELRDSDGNVLCSATNVDTKPGTPTTPAFIIVGAGQAGLSGTGYITDLHVWDDTGSICNTWTDPTQIDTLLPNGAGSSTQWTPSTGANWQCVDEQPMSTTDFVSTAGENTGYKDLYTFGNLSASPESIYSLYVTASVSKDNAGPGKLKTDVLSGASSASSSALTLPENGTSRVGAAFEVDPATSAEWDQTGINASEFGFEVSA